MISIMRERWAITRNDTEIFCGLARNYEFKPISGIGDSAIKTYMSKNKAISSFNKSWDEDYDGMKYKAVRVMESVKEIEQK